MATATVLPTTTSLLADLPLATAISKKQISFEKLGRLQKKKLLSSSDLDQKIRTLGGLFIGKALKSKEARNQHLFSKLSADSHTYFLTEAFFKQPPQNSREAAVLIKAWVKEFEKAPSSEQLAIVNKCFGQNLIAKLPCHVLHSLLKDHLKDLTPEVLTEISQNISLFELENLIKTFDLDSLAFFIKLMKHILEERLSLVPAKEISALKTLSLCLNASASLLIESKLDTANTSKAIACMDDSEVLLLFNNTHSYSVNYFLRLNDTLAQKVLALMDSSCETTFTHWLKEIPPTNKRLYLVLEKLTIEAQVDFLFKNPRNFTTSDLITLLSYLPHSRATEICRINPLIDLTSPDERDNASILLNSLCTTQLIILSRAPEYFAFVERHLHLFDEETLKDIFVFSKDNARTLSLLDVLQKDDFKWVDIVQSIAPFTPKIVLAALITKQITKKYFDIQQIAPQTLRSVASFKQIALSKTPSEASLISSLFMSTQAEVMQFQQLTSVIKSLERLCIDCSMPTLFNKAAAPTLKRYQLRLLKETLQSSCEFSRDSIQWRAQALLRSETVVSTSPTLLSWMSPLESSDTEQVVQMYASIRQALDEIGITNQRLTTLDYSYEDILETGLRGDNLRGIKNEYHLLEYIKLYQALKDSHIDITDTDILIEELLLIGLNKDTLTHFSINSLEDLQRWRSDTLEALIQEVLAEINITPAKLQESGYECRKLVTIGLRDHHFKTLEDLPHVISLIQTHESLYRALCEIDIDSKQLSKIGYKYEDLFASGLSGNDLQGITNKSELIQYIKIYQFLKAIGISLKALSDINTSIQTLILLGLNNLKIEAYPMTDIESFIRWLHEAIEDSLHSSLNKLGIDQRRLSALGYRDEELLNSGLTGQNLHGITNETDLVKYMSLYQALKSLDILPENLKKINTSIQTLIELELRAEDLTEPLNIETLARQVEKLDLKRTLRTMSLTSVVLERIGYTLDGLYETGLRSGNLGEKGIYDRRSLLIYMKNYFSRAA
jgi:hypothetical protein